MNSDHFSTLMQQANDKLYIGDSPPSPTNQTQYETHPAICVACWMVPSRIPNISLLYICKLSLKIVMFKEYIMVGGRMRAVSKAYIDWSERFKPLTGCPIWMLLTLCTKRVLRDLDPTFEDSSPRKNPVAWKIPPVSTGVGFDKKHDRSMDKPKETQHFKCFNFSSRECLMSIHLRFKEWLPKNDSLEKHHIFQTWEVFNSCYSFRKWFTYSKCMQMAFLPASASIAALQPWL